jgi:hypothetical protein
MLVAYSVLECAIEGEICQIGWILLANSNGRQSHERGLSSELEPDVGQLVGEAAQVDGRSHNRGLWLGPGETTVTCRS